MNQPEQNLFNFPEPISPSNLRAPSILAVSSLPVVSPHAHSCPPKATNRRARFALQIKFLLKVLKDAGEEQLRNQARVVISTCTRQNRMGDPNFSPLEDVVESYLRALVGEVYWEVAQSYQRRYLQQKYRRQCAAAVAMHSAAIIRARSNSVQI
jgi:hypothetical protein